VSWKWQGSWEALWTWSFRVTRVTMLHSPFESPRSLPGIVAVPCREVVLLERHIRGMPEGVEGTAPDLQAHSPDGKSSSSNWPSKSSIRLHAAGCVGALHFAHRSRAPAAQSAGNVPAARRRLAASRRMRSTGKPSSKLWSYPCPGRYEGDVIKPLWKRRDPTSWKRWRRSKILIK
jgi:hypothetical protein